MLRKYLPPLSGLLFAAVMVTRPYEDEIRSVEGPDADRGDPEGTARCEETERPEPATYSSPSFLISSAKRGSSLSESAVGSARM